MNDYLIHVSDEQSFLVEQVHIHMDGDGNRYQVQSVERLTKSRKSTLGIA